MEVLSWILLAFWPIFDSIWQTSRNININYSSAYERRRDLWTARSTLLMFAFLTTTSRHAAGPDLVRVTEHSIFFFFRNIHIAFRPSERRKTLNILANSRNSFKLVNITPDAGALFQTLFRAVGCLAIMNTKDSGSDREHVLSKETSFLVRKAALYIQYALIMCSL